MRAMSPLFQRIAAVVLTYLGISVPAPAPEGWQSFHGPGFTLHLPPGWQRLPPGNQPPGGAVFRFAAWAAPDAPKVVVGMNEEGRLYLSDLNILRRYEKGFREGLESEIDRIDPRPRYELSSPVYDVFRQRLWYRLLLAGPSGQLSHLDLFVLQSTTKGILEIDGYGAAGDEDFEEMFGKIVGSFELDKSLQYHEPYFWLGHIEENLSAESALSRSEQRLLVGSLVFFLPFIVSCLGLFMILLLDASLLRGRLKRAAIRRLQGWGLLRATGSARTRAWMRRIPLPWSLGCQLALALILGRWMIPRFLHWPQLYGPVFLAPCYLVGYGLLALAMACHYIPGSSRRLKYELLGLALSVFAVPGTLADPVSHATILGRDASFIFGFYTANYLGQTWFFVVAGLIFGQLLWAGKEATSARRASFLYRRTLQLKVLPAVMIGLAPLFPAGGAFISGFISLVAIYLIGQRSLENPILYLRSFHDHNTPVVLAKIVMPAAVRFAPVIATAHALQPPEELYRKTNFLTAARLQLLPDSAWQEWILATLPRCRAVLVDVSVSSGSLVWELEHARAVLPAEKIVVLVQEEAPPIDLPGVLVVRYRLGWRGQWVARKALRRWLKKLCAAPQAAEALSPLTATPASD